MSRLIQGAKYVFVRYPITRGMVAFGGLAAAANATQQSLDKTRTKYDPYETVRFGVFAGFVMAPLIQFWLFLSQKAIKGNTMKISIVRSICEQFTIAPVNYAVFFFGISLLEGKNPSQCTQVVKEKVPPVWKAGLVFWPPIQVINYQYVAPVNRVMYFSVFNFCWNIFLSYIYSRQKKHVDMIEETIATESNHKFKDNKKEI